MTRCVIKCGGAEILTSSDAIFISTKPSCNLAHPLHGTFIGPKGALAVFGRFADVLDSSDFEVRAAFGDDIHAALFGTLRQTVRATSKTDWALITRAMERQLIFYHFYEDTEALSKAIT